MSRFMFLVWYPRIADVPRQMSLRRFPGSSVLSYVIIMFKYTCTYNRVTSICIDLCKIKLLVWVFVFVLE